MNILYPLFGETTLNAMIICYENIGNWTSYDLDGGTTWGANDLDFENESYVGSSIIFNYPLAVTTGGDISVWNTYEGNQGYTFLPLVQIIQLFLITTG